MEISYSYDRKKDSHYKEGSYCRLFSGYAKIYTLSDIDGNVFYVGCTVQSVVQRLKVHLSEAKSPISKVNKVKIDKIRSLNYEITATIIDMKPVTAKKRSRTEFATRKWEQDWIQKYIDLGYNLTNREAQPKKEPLQPVEFIGQEFEANANSIKIKQTT